MVILIFSGEADCGSTSRGSPDRRGCWPRPRPPAARPRWRSGPTLSFAPPSRTLTPLKQSVQKNKVFTWCSRFAVVDVEHCDVLLKSIVPVIPSGGRPQQLRLKGVARVDRPFGGLQSSGSVTQYWWLCPCNYWAWDLFSNYLSLWPVMYYRGPCWCSLAGRLSRLCKPALHPPPSTACPD